MNNKIENNKLPKTVGNFTHLLLNKDLVFLSGQGPQDFLTGKIHSDNSIEFQTKLTLKNIETILATENLSLKNIIRLDIFITDFSNWDKVNKIIGETFSKPFPTRQIIGSSALYKGIGIEITAIAVKS